MALALTSTVGVSIQDFPFQVPREALGKMSRGELTSPLLDFLLTLGFLQKLQKGEVTPLPEDKIFEVRSPGLFLVDTGASSTLIKAGALQTSTKHEILEDVSWASQMGTVAQATDIINLPVCRVKVKIGGQEFVTKTAFIDAGSQERYHLLGTDILRQLGDSITIDWKRQRLSF